MFEIIGRKGSSSISLFDNNLSIFAVPACGIARYLAKNLPKLNRSD